MADTGNNSKLPSILVVDDIEMNRMIIEEILKDDYTVYTAGNGVEALNILKEFKHLPKLVLLDIIMPEMNGYELFSIMKADPNFKKIPVVFITTSDSEVEALSAGAMDFISKPFHPEIVKLRVANQVKLKDYSDNLEELVAEKTKEITESLDHMLDSMANIIEYRNLESGSHVKRTTVLSEALIKRLLNGSPYAAELKAIEYDIIIKSVSLHDVGKIGIPDAILLKPGRLTPDEFEIMKTHTIMGKKIIETILSERDALYLNHCRNIAYCHHERYDGKGYPRGIKGDGIPLSARILSIVDVYDALVCPRVYKNAIPYEEAVEIIKSGRGTQFDPVVTDYMLEIKDEFQALSQKYQ